MPKHIQVGKQMSHELSPERTAEAERWRGIISGYIGGLTLHENPGTYCADLEGPELKT